MVNCPTSQYRSNTETSGCWWLLENKGGPQVAGEKMAKYVFFGNVPLWRQIIRFRPVTTKTRKNARKTNRSTVLVALLAAGVLVAYWRNEAAPLPAATVVTVTNQPAFVATANSVLGKLNGHWRRPDGGYVIEIRNVESSGKMDASYFNPRPIHVAKAEAVQTGGTARVFIELRDVNYPGSTYTLTYDPLNDDLKGIYFQAALQQTFDVGFVRLKQ